MNNSNISQKYSVFSELNHIYITPQHHRITLLAAEINNSKQNTGTTQERASEINRARISPLDSIVKQIHIPLYLYV